MTRRLSIAGMMAVIVAVGGFTVACMAAGAGASAVQKPKNPASGTDACPGAEAESVAAIPPSPALGNSPAELTYAVGKSDGLMIRVEPDITISAEGRCSRAYTVGADGMINFCNLGAIKLEGKTEREIEAFLKKEFQTRGIYVAPSPQVNVEVTTPRSQAVFVSGEVRTPGSTQIDKPSEMTLNHAIAAAGGTTPQAGPDVYILRPRRTSADGQAQPVEFEDTTAQRFKYSRKVLQSTFQDPPILAGDTIWVVQAEMFIINGEVKASGIKVWEPCITVGDAIAMASGLTEKGSLNRLYIQRKNARGQYDKVGNLKLETLLLPKDTLVIGKRLF